MTSFKFGRAAAVAAIATLALTSCAANEGGDTGSDDSGTDEPSSSLSGNLVGIGASSMGSAQEAWIAGFQTANEGVTVDYDPQGSGAGRESFMEGAAAFAGSDEALSDEDLEGTFASCAEGTKAIDLPVYISPIAVIYNIDGVDDLNLDAETIANIFNGSITNWNDEAIADLNPDAELPDLSITAVNRSEDSGTTENFTAYIVDNAPDAWGEEPSGIFPFDGGEGAQGTSGVVDAVTNGSGTIGYADASRAGELGVANIQVGEEFVSYTAAGAAAVVAGSPLVEGREDNDLALELNRATTEAGQYPIVLVSYAIACQEYADPAEAELAKAYLGYIASEEGQAVSAEAAGSAPLSPELSEQVAAAIDSIS